MGIQTISKAKLVSKIFGYDYQGRLFNVFLIWSSSVSYEFLFSNHESLYNSLKRLSIEIKLLNGKNIWWPPSLSELTPMVFNTGLTHLGSEASIYDLKIKKNKPF